MLTGSDYVVAGVTKVYGRFLRADLLSTVPRLRLNHCLLVRCRFEQSAGLAARRRVAFAANQPTTKDSVFNQSGKYQQHFS